MDTLNISSQFAFKAPADSADRVKDMKLRQACADFEAIMLRQVLAAMRKSVPEGGLLEGGYAGDMYRSMQDEQLASNLAHGKGMGLGEALYRQVAKQTAPGGSK
jgi:peptidoglycan hydrolase FlgJ